MKTTFAALMVSILFHSLSISPPVYSQVIINEVMYAPVSPAKEWFELKNVSQTPVNLQNWKWRDAAAGNPLRIITTINIELLPDSFAVVCEDSVNFRDQYPSFYGIILQSPAWSALNNSEMKMQSCITLLVLYLIRLLITIHGEEHQDFRSKEN
ncbi:MAG: lamin tail domain-containing protein [Ignavibacteria bacterium]|nr:lamin tail domain-containing protein [Ignavibacteria bacterium]